MSRIHTLFAALAPVVLAGAFIGASARSTRADDGNDVTQDVSDDDADNDNDAGTQQAQRDAQHAARDAQRAARDAQRAARQEAHDAVRRARDEAREQIRAAREQITHDGSIPPAIRSMVLKRLDQAQKIVDQHLDRAANADDLGTLTSELSAMGAELGQTMGGMGDDMKSMQKDMAKMGRDMAKQWAGKNWKFHFDGNGASASAGDDDDDRDVDVDVHVVPPTPPMPPMPPMPAMPPMPPMAGAHGPDVDLSDLDVNVNLDDLQLSQPQRDQLQQILADEQQASEQAEQQIDGLSEGLRGMLQDPNAPESDISKMVDQINTVEGTYRKERILAWARARKVLSEQQRDALMRVTRHHGHHHSR